KICSPSPNTPASTRKSAGVCSEWTGDTIHRHGPECWALIYNFKKSTMKLRNMNKFFFAPILALLVVSCGKEYVELDPTGTGTFLEENYYSDETQAFSGLIATYDILGKETRGFENMVTMMNAGSDDHHAGGGGPDDGAGIHAFADYSITPST